MPLPKILTDAEAKLALETPQVVLSWTTQADPYYFNYDMHLYARRRYDRFPVSGVDGTLVATIHPYMDIASYADTGVTGDSYAYYGLYSAQLHRRPGGVAPKTFSLARKVQRVLGVGYDNTIGSPNAPSFWMSGIDNSGTRFISLYDADSPINHDIDAGTFERDLDITGILQENEYLVGSGMADAYGASTQGLLVVTNQRCLVLDVSATDTITNTEILVDLDLASRMSAGFNPKYGNGIISGGGAIWLVLDSANQELAHILVGGTTLCDYSGLSYADHISNIGYSINNGGPVLGFANHINFISNAPPWTDNDIDYGVVQPYWMGESSLLCHDDASVYLGSMEEDSKIYYVNTTYSPVTESWFLTFPSCTRMSILHLEDVTGAVNAIDSMGGVAPLVGGLTLEQAGAFGSVYTKGYRNDGTGYINNTVKIASMSPSDGTVDFYFKADGSSFWTTATGSFFTYQGDTANDYVDLSISGSTLTLTYERSAPGPFLLTNTWVMSPADYNWHHFMVTWHFGVGADYCNLYVDNVLRITLAIPGVFNAAAPIGLSVCGSHFNPAGSVIGYYDEISLATVPSLPAYTTTYYTRQAWLHSWTGRTYNPPTAFEFRDQLFDDFLPEATRERDLRGSIEHWFPQVTVSPTSDAEVLHRGGDLVDGGQLRAICRMFGLMFDRVVDHRGRVLVDRDIDEVSYAEISKLSKLIGLEDVRRFMDVYMSDDMQMIRYRQIVRGMTEVWRRKGSLSSLYLFAKLFHIALHLDVTYYRRFWDSCADPSRADITLDSTFLDSYYAKLGQVNLMAFNMDYACESDINGVTGAAGTNTFDSAGKAWVAAPQPRAGDMLCIKDMTPGTIGANNTNCLVASIAGATQLTINRNWTVSEGGLAALTYEVWRYIPEVDPVAQFILYWAKKLVPYNIDVVYADHI